MSVAKTMPNAVKVEYAQKLAAVWAVPKMATVLRINNVMYNEGSAWMERMVLCIARRVTTRHHVQVACAAWVLDVTPLGTDV